MSSLVTLFRRLLVTVALIVACDAIGSGPNSGGSRVAAAEHGEFANEFIQVGKTRREFRLIVPKSVQLTKPAPLVIAFHGMLIDSKNLMPLYTKLNDTAEREKFVLVFPQAIGRSWGLSPEKIQNDLAFFDALLQTLKLSYKIDADRVYLVGMSNGGYFAHLVARERSQEVAAIASHSGPLGLQSLFGIKAERKFAVLIIHGDQDRIFPVAIARENRNKYEREGHEVEYIEVPGLGHVWGTPTEINESIWKFFAAHPRPKP